MKTKLRLFIYPALIFFVFGRCSSGDTSESPNQQEEEKEKSYQELMDTLCACGNDLTAFRINADREDSLDYLEIQQWIHHVRNYHWLEKADFLVDHLKEGTFDSEEVRKEVFNVLVGVMKFEADHSEKVMSEIDFLFNIDTTAFTKQERDDLSDNIMTLRANADKRFSELGKEAEALREEAFARTGDSAYISFDAKINDPINIHLEQLRECQLNILFGFFREEGETLPTGFSGKYADRCPEVPLVIDPTMR